MIGYLITDSSMGGLIISDWADNGDGTESPDLAGARAKAREILEARIAFLESRIHNLDDLNPTDDSFAEDCLNEAADDLDFGFEPVEITGEGATAEVRFIDLDVTRLLGDLAKDAGRFLPVRWPPIDSPQSGEQDSAVSSTMEGNS